MLAGVTVVTPVYNGAAYIEETLLSVLEQNYPQFEYIVVDDGSTDDTAAIVQKYAGRLTLLSQPNSGESAAVNAGLAAASYDLTCIVNADDLILPGLITAAAGALDSDPAVVAIYPDWRMIDEHGKTIASTQTREFDYRMMLEEHYCIPGPGTIFRRSAFGDEPVRSSGFPLNGDFEAWLRLGLKGPMKRLPQVFACWRRHAEGASLSNRSRALARDRIRVIDSIFARSDLVPEVASQKAQSLSAAYYFAAILGLHDNTVPARRYLMKSVASKCLWPARISSPRRRSWKLMLYLALLPFSLPLKRLYGRYLDWRGYEHDLGSGPDLE